MTLPTNVLTLKEYEELRRQSDQVRDWNASLPPETSIPTRATKRDEALARKAAPILKGRRP